MKLGFERRVYPVQKNDPGSIRRYAELVDQLPDGRSRRQFKDIGVAAGSIGQVLGQGGVKIQFDSHNLHPVELFCLGSLSHSLDKFSKNLTESPYNLKTLLLRG
jgi:hypothetical protein